jgi:hypothetical protein
MFCGVAGGFSARSLEAGDFLGAASQAAIAIYIGYLVTKLSNFGYQFSGRRRSALAKSPDDGRSGVTR